MIKNVYWYSCKVPFILVRFLDRLSKNPQISNFMKICQVGAEFVPCGRTDGRTDMTKLIVAFRNFTNASKNDEVV